MRVFLCVFHVQLRQFPHNHTRFNLGEEQMRSLAEQWVRGEWLVMGERRWNAYQAKLTVIEGSEIPVQQLSMGRGWRYAQRNGEDVTQRVLGAAGAAQAGGPAAATAPRALAGAAVEPDEAGGASVAVVESLLGGHRGAEALLAAWRETTSRFPERSPSECLALAEEQLGPATRDDAR